MKLDEKADSQQDSWLKVSVTDTVVAIRQVEDRIIAITQHGLIYEVKITGSENSSFLQSQIIYKHQYQGDDEVS